MGVLKTFTGLSQGKYSAYIISMEQARGLDFPTSSAIEDKGGNYVLLGSLPDTHFAFQQALGRTCRIGHKGQVSIILWEQKADHNAGAHQIQQLIDKLEGRETVRLSALKNKAVKAGKAKVSRYMIPHDSP
jgi:hypothetical protein